MQAPLVRNSKRHRNAILWVLCCLVALLEAPAASASDALGPPASIELVLLGKLGKNAVLRERITSWFEPDRFRVHVRSAKSLDAAEVLAPSREYVLSVWILFAGTSAHLYFAAAAQKGGDARYLVRELTLDNGLDEIGAEQLAEVVHLSALALFEGELHTPRQDLERTLATSPKTDAATAREEAAIERELSKRPQRPAEAGRRGADRLDLGVGYGVSFHSEEGVWHGPRANLGLRLGPAFGVFVSSAFSLPQTHDLGPLSLRIEALSLVTGVRLVRRLAPALALELLAGPGVEIVHYAPEGAAPGVSLGSSATEARPELTTGLAAVLLDSRAWRAALVFELALSLSRTRYELSAGGERRIIAEPAQLVPRLGLEAKF